MNLLLKDIFYGDELPQLEKGSVALRQFFDSAWPRVELGGGSLIIWRDLYSHVRSFFKAPRPGIFDGPITAGDALVIAAFMAAIRPKTMVEIGVASGFSSSFILQTARWLECATAKSIYLHSLDVVSCRENGARTGQLLFTAYPELAEFWKLHAPATSLDLLKGNVRLACEAPVLAFIDGGHAHPWPVTDLVAMHEVLPAGSWVLMQDMQIMERWISDCVRYGAPAGAPLRGVQLAVSLWPGTKWIGHGMCYNMAAVRLDVSKDALLRYVNTVFDYPDETAFDDREFLLKGVVGGRI